MYFKNEAHKTAFVHAAKKANAKDRRMMCKLYLLTADRALWRAAKRESNGGKYPLGRIRLAFGTESSYTLLCCAKDLTLGTDHITAADLADREVISPKLYKNERAKIERQIQDLWYERREEVIRTYTETLPPRVPLSENDAFKSVRNAVICAAMDIVRGTMPDTEQLNGEIQAAEPADKEVEKKYLPNFKTTWQLYFWAKDLLDYENDGYSPHKAAWLLEACAKRGNTVAKYRLGKMYLKGDEIEKDIATALQWLSQAAEDGNEFAEYLLGKTYLKGEDVELDTAKAETYLRRAAGRGNKYAAYTLGKALLDGDVLKQDISEAIRYLNRPKQRKSKYIAAKRR